MEVKSSNYRKHKSLDDFCDKYSSRVGEKIVLHTKDLDFKESTLYLPVYMAQFI